MSDRAAPWLICLNLNREYVTPGRPLFADQGEVAAACARRVVHHARSSGWTVAHVQTRGARLANADQFQRPIEALEPLPSEPLFLVRGRSAFVHSGLRDGISSDRPSRIYLIGFALAHEGLATLLHGLDTGLPVRVVADACASPPIGDRSAAEIDRATLAIAGSLSALADSREIFQVANDVVVNFRGA